MEPEMNAPQFNWQTMLMRRGDRTFIVAQHEQQKHNSMMLLHGQSRLSVFFTLEWDRLWSQTASAKDGVIA